MKVVRWRDFDIIICDEAHRTTGVTLADGDDSAFVRIHTNPTIRADKRLYMTATPRLFNNKVKDAAKEKSPFSVHEPEIAFRRRESIKGASR